MINNNGIPEMKTMVSCINQLLIKGYTEDFKASERDILALQHERLYSPEQIQVVNFFRFEGASDPADNSILYVIETDDGIKGTLTDAYGPYADANVTKFIDQVNDINKKTVNSDALVN